MREEREVKTLKKEKHAYQTKTIKGQSLSQGIIIGEVAPYQTKKKKRQNNLSFEEAINRSLNELTQSQNSISLAQKELLISLQKKAKNINQLQNLITQESHSLIDTAHASKISDYTDILQRVQRHLGVEEKMILPQTPFILMADDLLPSQIEFLSTYLPLRGIILHQTSSTSHTAILLRASGIASIIADAPLLNEHQTIILDTYAGVIVPHPSPNDIEIAQLFQDKKTKESLIAHDKRFETAYTSTHQHIQLFANISDVASAHTAKAEGAEGVGLLRSEFLFTSLKPTLETQTQAYREIFDIFEHITVRTLDVGGDKSLPYLYLPLESNPFLGVRGVRLFRTHPEIMQEQLLAIFLASENRPIKIMFPMVSCVEEFTKAKAIALSIAQTHHIDISNILFGIMIEVPSVLFLIEAFNDVVDFYSIGTNDLTQYLFATERTHPLLKVDTRSPVIFSVISQIAQKVTKPLSICGELASDTQAIPQLIALGITTLSVSPKTIAQSKETIRNV